MTIIWTKNDCYPCKMSKKWMTDRGVEFEERNVEENPAYLAEVKERSYLQVPVIESNGTHWSGFRPDMLEKHAASLVA